MQALLRRLGIDETNPGGFCGEWLGGDDSLTSNSPIDGKPIARVRQCTPVDAERIINRAHDAFLKWRTVPAPARGETIRRLGNALREVKKDLGELVTIENGKIRAE